MVAEVVVVESALLCVGEALAVVNGTDDWLVSRAAILVSVPIWFEGIALDLFLEPAQATLLIKE